jgi:hypothetical protein
LTIDSFQSLYRVWVRLTSEPFLPWNLATFSFAEKSVAYWRRA